MLTSYSFWPRRLRDSTTFSTRQMTQIGRAQLAPPAGFATAQSVPGSESGHLLTKSGFFHMVEVCPWCVCVAGSLANNLTVLAITQLRAIEVQIGSGSTTLSSTSSNGRHGTQVSLW